MWRDTTPSPPTLSLCLSLGLCVKSFLSFGKYREREGGGLGGGISSHDKSACKVWVDSDILKNSTLNLTLLLPRTIQYCSHSECSASLFSGLMRGQPGQPRDPQCQRTWMSFWKRCVLWHSFENKWSYHRTLTLSFLSLRRTFSHPCREDMPAASQKHDKSHMKRSGCLYCLGVNISGSGTTQDAKHQRVGSSEGNFHDKMKPLLRNFHFWFLCRRFGYF